MFWIGVAYRKWSLTRSGSSWIFDCMQELGCRISGHVTKPGFLIHATLYNQKNKSCIEMFESGKLSSIVNLAFEDVITYSLSRLDKLTNTSSSRDFIPFENKSLITQHSKIKSRN